jgi:hypothetical protein
MDEGICRGGDATKCIKIRTAKWCVVGKVAALWALRVKPI